MREWGRRNPAKRSSWWPQAAKAARAAGTARATGGASTCRKQPNSWRWPPLSRWRQRQQTTRRRNPEHAADQGQAGQLGRRCRQPATCFRGAERCSTIIVLVVILFHAEIVCFWSIVGNSKAVISIITIVAIVFIVSIVAIIATTAHTVSLFNHPSRIHRRLAQVASHAPSTLRRPSSGTSAAPACFVLLWDT